MQLSNLKQLERIRILRRDKNAVKLAELRNAFSPIDGALAANEDILGAIDRKTKALNTRIGSLTDVSLTEVREALEGIETQLIERTNLELKINNIHKERLELLGAIRSARHNWREASKSCDRWEELLKISALVSEYNERVAEENSSGEAIFYIKNLKA
jgi:hypothetical protein